MRHATPLALVASLAAYTPCAAAQVATWYWTVSDTGNGDGVIEPGESALLTLWVSFEPRQDEGGAFARAGLYDMLGNDAWAAGTVEMRQNLLNYVYDNDWLDEANSIRGVGHFQYPGFFEADERNPIDLYVIRWTPDDYSPRTVTLDNGGPDAYIYTDPFGGDLPYSGAGGFVEFSVVPAPGAGALLAIAALSAARRRR